MFSDGGCKCLHCFCVNTCYRGEQPCKNDKKGRVFLFLSGHIFIIREVISNVWNSKNFQDISFLSLSRWTKFSA